MVELLIFHFIIRCAPTRDAISEDHTQSMNARLCTHNDNVYVTCTALNIYVARLACTCESEICAELITEKLPCLASLIGTWPKWHVKIGTMRGHYFWGGYFSQTHPPTQFTIPSISFSLETVPW